MKNSIANFENEIVKLEDEKIKVLARIEAAQTGKEETVIKRQEILIIKIKRPKEKKI